MEVSSRHLNAYAIRGTRSLFRTNAFSWIWLTKNTQLFCFATPKPNVSFPNVRMPSLSPTNIRQQRSTTSNFFVGHCAHQGQTTPPVHTGRVVQIIYGKVTTPPSALRTSAAHALPRAERFCLCVPQRLAHAQWRQSRWSSRCFVVGLGYVGCRFWG